MAMKKFLPIKLQRFVSWYWGLGTLSDHIWVIVFAVVLVLLVIQQIQWAIGPPTNPQHQQFVYDLVRADKLRWKDLNAENRAIVEKSLREAAKEAGIHPEEINVMMRDLRRGDEQ